jgi:hypothetical protein
MRHLYLIFLILLALILILILVYIPITEKVDEMKDTKGLELADISPKHIDLVPNQSKNTTFIFYSNESGNLSVSVKKVSTLFSDEKEETPEFIKIRVEPSKMKVEPGKVYEIKISVTATDEAKNFVYGNKDPYRASVIRFVNLDFIVEAGINGRTAKEWFSVSVLPPSRMDPSKPLAIPGRLHLARERIPSSDYLKLVELEREKTELPFEFYSGSFPVSGEERVRITLYLVREVGDYERLDSNSKSKSGPELKAKIEPSSFLVSSRNYYKTRLTIDARYAEAKEYVIGVFVHHGSTILDASWISVRVR